MKKKILSKGNRNELKMERTSALSFREGCFESELHLHYFLNKDIPAMDYLECIDSRCPYADVNLFGETR